jgi:hypothetical protein
VPQKLNIDNSTCYRSESLENTCAWIGKAFGHSRPYISQCSGKIPQGLIGKKIELRFHAHESDVFEVFFQNYSHGFARRVDVHVNARVGRHIISASKNEQDIALAALEVQPAFTGGQLFGTEEGEDEV